MDSAFEKWGTDVGNLLRQRREELGLSLENLAGKTRIRRDYLSALEENRFEFLPAPAYLTGFLRSYAGELGLDPEEMLRRLRAQTDTPQISGKEPEACSGPPFAKKQPLRPLIMLLSFGFAASLLLFYGLYGHGQGSSSVQAPPASSLLAAARAIPDPVPAVANDGGAPKTEIPVVVDTGRPAAEPSAHRQKLPSIPLCGGMLRLEACAPVVVEVQVDDRMPRRYDLVAKSVLRWKVAKRIRLAVNQPESVALWLDETPFAMGGRSELELLTAAKGNQGLMQR